jgi:hypothetical protein
MISKLERIDAEWQIQEQRIKQRTPWRTHATRRKRRTSRARAASVSV